MRWFEYKMEVDDLHASDDLKAKLLAMQGGQTASSAPKAAPKPRKAIRFSRKTLSIAACGLLCGVGLYAAVGAAVDSAGDAGQFVMPITIPLLVAFYCAFLSVENPNGPVAFWMSMIPLTSPVMMMVRIPFGVPAWEVVVSALLLVAAFLAVTWMAAKIYRIGLLSYGNKPTYKDLWRWIRMN